MPPLGAGLTPGDALVAGEELARDALGPPLASGEGVGDGVGVGEAVGLGLGARFLDVPFGDGDGDGVAGGKLKRSTQL